MAGRASSSACPGDPSVHLDGDSVLNSSGKQHAVPQRILRHGLHLACGCSFVRTQHIITSTTVASERCCQHEPSAAWHAPGPAGG